MSPFSNYRTASLGGEQIEQEVAIRAAGAHGAIENERAECPVVACVVAVLAEADELASHFEKVLSALPRQVVAVGQLVVDRAAGRGCQTDIGESVPHRNGTETSIGLA